MGWDCFRYCFSNSPTKHDDNFYDRQAIRYMSMLVERHNHHLPYNVNDVQQVMQYVEELGLLQPFADDLRYLKNMHQVSKSMKLKI